MKKRQQAHQNTFAFKHNKGSKLTKKIEGEPLTFLCKRCYAKLEWRKKFRKFKLRTVPGRCPICEVKNVFKGHRKLCDKCSRDRNLCSKCFKEPIWDQSTEEIKETTEEIKETTEEIKINTIQEQPITQ